MQDYYGVVIIKKGSILYHTSPELFKYKNRKDKPLLFCTFHPSEYGANNINSYVHSIKLKKDVSLLFMIEKIQKNLIFSSLHLFTKNEMGDFSKMNDKKLLLFSDKLKSNNFDGWFTSINNKINIEVALLNNRSLFELINSDKIDENWINSNYINNKIVQKNWGIKYPICTIKNPVIFIINERYKKQLAKHKKAEIKSKLLLDTVFHVILNNAIFYFIKGEYKNFNWNI